MELTIGKKLKNLRRERELTQEELAAHLGISFQAISKWERGEGYPDITMLPVLAKYFGVTADTLLGMDEIEARRRYEDINSAWRKEHDLAKKYEKSEPERAAEGHRRNAERMRGALKGFPNDPLLLVQLSASLHGLSRLEDDGREYLRQSVETEEHILRYCDDCEVRGATMYNICFSYEKLGERDKAVEQAKKLPNLYKARENALAYFLNGEDRRENAANALAPLMWSLSIQLEALADEEHAPEYREKMLKILDILFEGEEDEQIRKIRSRMER